MKQGALGLIYDLTHTQVLLIQRRDVPVWVLPGGGIDENETPEEAICREVREETGLEVRVVRKVAEYVPINALVKPAHLFECRVISGLLLTTTSETRACAYFCLDNLPQDLFFIHKDFIQDATANLPPQQKSLTQVTYWNLAKYFIRHPWQVLRFARSYFTAS